MLTAAREVAFTVSGGDILAAFLLGPLAFMFLRFGMYVCISVALGGPPTVAQALVVVLIVVLFVLGAFGIWEFSHWIVRE